MPVIGLLSPRSPAIDAPLIAVIRQGLSDTGHLLRSGSGTDRQSFALKFMAAIAGAADLPQAGPTFLRDKAKRARKLSFVRAGVPRQSTAGNRGRGTAHLSALLTRRLI